MMKISKNNLITLTKGSTSRSSFEAFTTRMHQKILGSSNVRRNQNKTKTEPLLDPRYEKEIIIIMLAEPRRRETREHGIRVSGELPFNQTS